MDTCIYTKLWSRSEYIMSFGEIMLLNYFPNNSSWVPWLQPYRGSLKVIINNCLWYVYYILGHQATLYHTSLISGVMPCPFGLNLLYSKFHTQWSQYDLVNMTLVYTTPSILRHIFARPNFEVHNSLFYTTTTLDNATFRISVLSYQRGS